MRPPADAPPWKHRWEPAMEEIEDDIDFTGMEYYELPTGDVLYPGDEFWHTEERYVLAVETVKTKVLTDTRGEPLAGDEGTDYVFYDRDWQPPRDPRFPTHWTDDIHSMAATEFAEQIATGVLVAHRGNGCPPRAP